MPVVLAVPFGFAGAACAPIAPEEAPAAADAGESGAPASGVDGGGPVEASDAGLVEDAGEPAVDRGVTQPPAEDDREVDPFARQPLDPDALTDTSADLDAVLEQGALDGACERWAADPDDRRKTLLCGKSMFFDEGFGTIGVPTPLFDFIATQFPDELGVAFSNLGLIPDPRSGGERPLGVAPGAPLGDLDTLAFTCASCHFAKLPDGRYSVGAPNHDYDYGKQMLAISLAPNRVRPGFSREDHHPRAMADIADVLDKLDDDGGLRLRLALDLLPLLSASDAAPALSLEEEGFYADWKPGTMDFLMAPLPVDDGVHTVSKILSLWGMPHRGEREAEGLPSAQLAWTGGAEHLMGFLRGFVVIGDGTNDEWPDERLRPLAEYLYTLRGPLNPTPPDDDDVLAGEAVFFGTDLEMGERCIDCHDGPRGMGRELYSFEEIGTDDAMRHWGDPDLTGELCCGISGGEEAATTHALKSPRIAALWTMKRFLHNGALDSLDELLCRDGPRPTDRAYAFGAEGHTFGCEALSLDDKDALVAFLQSL